MANVRLEGLGQLKIKITSSGIESATFRLVLFVRNKYGPHTALLRAGRLGISAHPPFQRDFVPCDYHIFGPLKEARCGNTFQLDEEMQEMTRDYACSRNNFFSGGIKALVKRRRTCFVRNEDCVGK
jgi:hypothetical protein